MVDAVGPEGRLQGRELLEGVSRMPSSVFTVWDRPSSVTSIGKHLAVEAALVAGAPGLVRGFRAANSSASWREMPHLTAISSAEMPCGVRSYFFISSGWSGEPGPCMIVGAHRDAGHGLDAAADGDVAGAGLDEVGGEVDGLLGAAALAVYGRGGDRVGEVGGEEHVAGDVDALLADLVDAAEDDVLDHAGLDAGALDDLVQDHCAEVVGVDAGKDAVAAAHGRANGLYDDYFSHWVASFVMCDNILADAQVGAPTRFLLKKALN